MWHSLHGYINDFEAIDKYLMTNFNFIRDDYIKEFFFIRYWQNGPHIRLRFKCKEQDYSKVFDAFHSSIQMFLKENTIREIDRTSFNQELMAELEGTSFDDTLYNTGSVVKEPYKPEIERYGGTVAEMKKSEEVFKISSKFCAELNKISKSKRLLLALELMDLSFKLNGEKEFESGLKDYQNFWQPYKNEHINFNNNKLMNKFFKKLKKNQFNLSIYSEYIDTLIKTNIINDYQILFSHIHMTNNRLGITPDLEYAMSSFLADQYRGVDYD